LDSGNKSSILTVFQTISLLKVATKISAVTLGKKLERYCRC
jgi:hypothetical protein